MRRVEFEFFDASLSASGDAVSTARAVEDRQSVASFLNFSLVCIAVGGTLFQLYGMPFVLRLFDMRAAWLLLPIMLLQPLHWGLLHEGIHGRLFPNRRANEFCSRLLSVLLG